MPHSQTSPRTGAVSAWGRLMADIREDAKGGGGLLNTGLNISQLVLLVGLVVWSVTIKVTVDYHGDQLKEQRMEIAAIKSAREDRDIKNAERLAAIEVSVRELLRLAERDRRVP